MSARAMLPPMRPRLSSAAVAEILLGKNPQGVRIREAVAILGVRGYYRDSMGEPGKNDIGIYDDAIFVFSPQCALAFNANCDPSRLRPRIAQLALGLWWYQVGTHGLSKPASQRYTALVQAAPVTVNRHQAGAETGLFGINIHRGGYNTTSSLGCQTIHPDQWPSFIATVREQMKRHGQAKVPYLLIDGPIV